MFFFLHFVPFSSIRLCVVVLDLANRLRFSSPYSLFFLSPSSSSSLLDSDSGPTEEEYLLINGAAEDILTKLRFAWVFSLFFFVSSSTTMLITHNFHFSSKAANFNFTSSSLRSERALGIFERSWLSLHENLEHESDGKDFRFASFLSEISRARYAGYMEN